jgi:hypothetical protein
MPGRRRPDREPFITQLFHILATRFDEGELRTLCFNLSLDYDDLPGEGKANKARELISFLERRDRIAALLEIGPQVRPDIAWDEIAGGFAPEPSLADFVNRENELHKLNVERLRASRSPYVLINAPAGYGKSYLLQNLAHIVRSDSALCDEWNIRLVDLSPETDDQIGLIVRSITGLRRELSRTAATQNGPDTAIAFVRDHIVQKLAPPLAAGRRALLLIFDGVERLETGSRAWLYTLLHELRQRTCLGQQEIITVRVIFAGREVETFWGGYERAYPKPPVPQRFTLSPFDEHPIQTLIWKRAEAVQIALDDQTVAQIADQVGYLGGGHPGVICSLVNDLASQSFAIGPVADYFLACREHMVRTYLSSVAGELAEGLEAGVGQAVQILSVFRRVNANTVQALVQTGLLPPATNEVGLLGDIQRAHLLAGPGIREPFYRDHLMRRIWALNMAHGSQKSQAQYRRLNQVALELYAGWIHNLGSGLPDTPLKATQRLLSVVEWLFHALQDTEMSQDKLCATLQDHVRVLAQEAPALSVADLIADEIQQDRELGYLLRQRLGESGLDIIEEWLQDFSTDTF